MVASPWGPDHPGNQQAKERQRLSEGRGKKGPANLPDLKAGDARDQVGRVFGVSGTPS
ncbi:MAG: hypothetical protein H8K07_16455 [Nitrospira sp.]|jgi:hypothetical protein|nr:hypothetical protein [Nitrospira sp.]MDI3465034.1 hypothetical protein [Nitrospira sp.]